MALDPELDDLVAIKVGSEPTAIAAIEREAQVLRELRHPNVVELVRTERGPDGPVVVTQFAGRSTLADLKPVDETHVARVGASLLTIVADLHRMGWAHGRVSPDHCIVGANGRLTLCGVGSARRARTGSPQTDVDIAADLAAAIDTIATLVGRLPPPSDRVTRRRRRSLDSIMERTSVRPSSDAAMDARDALSRLAGAAPPARAAIDPDTTTRPGQVPGRRPAAPRGRDGDDTTGPTVVNRRRGRRSWKGAALALAMLLTMFGAVGFIRWIGGPLGDPLTSSGVQRIGDVPAPIRLALSVVRIAAFAACLYGIALSSATLAAIITRRSDVQQLATAMAPQRLRRALVALIGLGVISSVASGPTSTTTPVTVATHRVADSLSTDHPSEPPTTTQPSTTSPTSTAQPSTTQPSTTSPTSTRQPSATQPEPPSTAPPPPVRADDLPNLWVIEPGDHLWAVAESTMSRHLGRAATDTETDGYWRAVISLNRSSLVDPADPDLVFVGQVIELPPIDGGGPSIGAAP